MANFNQAFEKLVKNEGGYANNPADKGGETYKGIARKFWPQWEGWEIVDEKKQKLNFPYTLEVDILLQQQVKDFYKNNFWDKIQGDQIINQDIAFSIFDFAVNAGHTVSIKLAQISVGAMSDGVMGKQTLGLINSTDKELFLAKFALSKIAKYVKIVDADKSQSVFFFGWVKRVINS